ncbi:UDP-N-acetylmuramoylalanine--D-glutamate ligase [Shouchella clausii]|uniref:UDP-N-acetylmuramoyl-L-alanine--D-glutamate ligase n=1 Tax=Shouchella clausii TaxID=79880 RepID=UPI0007957D34|nr:UDP-N-acetylmuramoyl-L-alanine--D-glutamate ligase [Shouchella clausii]KKI84600.1 UDP-N-acetylmuramoyl-L-alanyl-D-glutamate synthetase [Shouchella clausii]GIN07396.1 UDP-N-acetylmuramoylalanine--D-glutamate ligase [Shouchella clausii]
MKQVKELIGKRVLVLGMAKSGVASALLLARLGAEVVINDSKSRAEQPQAGELEAAGIQVVCGGHPLTVLDGCSLLVKNPGIPYTNIVVKEAEARGIPIWTEIELAYLISEAEMVAITGSNGKTTTTTLVKEMLEHSGRKPLIAGNIGTVASEVAQKAKAEHVIVLEVSSFQLMGTNAFQPKVAVWLNIFDAHLDYHGTREDYIAAKARIAANMGPADYLVYNADDPTVVQAISRIGATLVPFSRINVVEDGAYVKDGTIFFKDEPILALADAVLPGAHNVENMLAATAAARLAGATVEQIRHVLSHFPGVKHRLQYVGSWEGRQFYNDSKATNILATKAALSGFAKPVVLIAGGLDRGNDFDELLASLKYVKAVVAYGETKSKLLALAAKANVQAVTAERVKDATEKAVALSQPGDVVLLSPACASWDQYRSFEERGDEFLDYVNTIIKPS